MKIFEAQRNVMLLVVFAAATFYLVPAGVSAQICAGSSLRYVVRDERGRIIDPTGTYETAAKLRVDELKDAQKVIKGVNGNSAKVLAARGMCNFLQPVQMTLKLKGKLMKLNFLTPRLGEYDSRSFLVDSLPFRAGAFEIDLTGAGETNPAGDWLGRFFPAKGWKKIRRSN